MFTEQTNSRIKSITKSKSSTKGSKNGLAKQSQLRYARPRSSVKGNKNKGKLNIYQAIDEALEDYTAEALDEYQSYESELSPVSPVLITKISDKKEEVEIDDSKRRHSFDLQLPKSPIPLIRKEDKAISELELTSSKNEVVVSGVKRVTMDDYIGVTDKIEGLLFRSSRGSPIPIKSGLSRNQEKELHLMILEIIQQKEVLFHREEESGEEESDEEEDEVLYYFSSSVVSRLMYELRYEGVYGKSIRCVLLEALSRFSLEMDHTITHFLNDYLYDYVVDERSIRFLDDEFITIQKQIGCIHRYTEVFQVLINSLRNDASITSAMDREQVQIYYDRADLLMHCMHSFILSKNSIEKYSESMSTAIIALFSIAPPLIQPFYMFILRHWPRGYTAKTVALIDFLENLLSASPPIYVTPYLKPIMLKVFKKLCAELLGSQVEVSKQIAYLFQNYYIRNNYIAMDEKIGYEVKVTLTAGKDHWNETIGILCEKSFDIILDDL